MLKSPVIKLRKAAPGSLTAKDVAEYCTKKRYPRTEQAIGDFERGKVLNPDDRLLELYAQAIGSTVEAVRRAQREASREYHRQDPTRARVA